MTALTLLVAYDLSIESDNALSRALSIAREVRGAVHVLHIVDSSLADAIAKQASDYALATISAAIARFDTNGVDVTVEVHVGDPKEDIAARAVTAKADMVVLGRHRKQRRDPFFGSTVAGRVVADARRPVLIAVDLPQKPYSSAVVGADFSPFSRAAIRWARRIAPLAAMQLVHAFEMPFPSRLTFAGFQQDFAYTQKMEMDEFLAEELDWLKQRAAAAGVPAEAISVSAREGSPENILPDAVRQTGADLLAIGTHGRTGIARFVLGSVASAIVAEPPCDVLIVPSY